VVPHPLEPIAVARAVSALLRKRSDSAIAG